MNECMNEPQRLSLLWFYQITQLELGFFPEIPPRQKLNCDGRGARGKTIRTQKITSGLINQSPRSAQGTRIFYYSKVIQNWGFEN